MRNHQSLFLALLVLCGFGIVGCESTGRRGFVQADRLADTKEEALALVGQLPSADEVSTDARTSSGMVTKGVSRVGLRDDSGAKKTFVDASSLADSGEGPKVTVTTPSEGMVPQFVGRVVLLNTKKGFVVVDFHGSRVPPVQSELGVYRDGVFVGSLRITDPVKPPLASADVLTGTLRRGDVVQ